MHIADVQLVLKNVCFEAKNGHDAVVTPFPFMTQSGHENYQNPASDGTGACVGGSRELSLNSRCSRPSTIQLLCRWVSGIATLLLLLLHVVVVSAQALGVLVFEKE